jgi:hypothetical protein
MRAEKRDADEHDLSRAIRSARCDPDLPACRRAAAAAWPDAAQYFRTALSRHDRRRAARGSPPDRHDPARPRPSRLARKARLVQDRLRRPPHSIAETGDGRYLVQLTGIARFRVEQEVDTPTAYRKCRVLYAPFADDFTARKGEEHVDRKALLQALNAFLKANNLKTDWEGVENAPNEALVNALSMMSPYGIAEKQALLEAPDLKSRAEILIAVTQIELAKKSAGGETPLQ